LRNKKNKANRSSRVVLIVQLLSIIFLHLPFQQIALAAQIRTASNGKGEEKETPQEKNKRLQKEHKERDRLLQERFAGSLKETIQKNEVMLEKHRAARDRFNETATLSKLGALYDPARAALALKFTHPTNFSPGLAAGQRWLTQCYRDGLTLTYGRAPDPPSFFHRYRP